MRYMAASARKFHVAEHCMLNHEVTECRFDESANEWVVAAKDLSRGDTAREFRGRFLIPCLGGLHVPAYPADVKGRGTLKTGAEVHSAVWDHKLDLAGKRVVVVGSAASAVQIIPQVAKVAKEVVVAQRTPNWLAPKKSPFLPPSLEYSKTAMWVMANVPGLCRLHRWSVYWLMEMPFLIGLWSGGPDSLGNRLGRFILTRFMRRQLRLAAGSDPALQARAKELEPKVIPQYAPGFKRIIRSEDVRFFFSLSFLARDKRFIP